MFRKRGKAHLRSREFRRVLAVEMLEGRRLLSAGGHGGAIGRTIEFDQAPSAVQTGLDNLATTAGLTAPTSTQTVFLSNVNGVERYSIDISGTGTFSVLTVNQAGDPVTAPTTTSTTFGTLSGSDSAVTDEITAIATALNLTAPTSSTTINVITTTSGTVSYSVNLASSSSSHGRGTTIALDSSGNPIGNENLPFSVFSSTIQNALNSNAPSGATALSSTSTQTVKVRTIDGVTTYSTTFTTSGTSTTVTVNSSGTLVNLPKTSTTTFGAIPSAAQTELQTLATDDGYSGTISSTQSVSVYDEVNGTDLYTVSLPASKTGSSGNTYTITLTLTVDEDGNPTTLPTDNGGGFGGGLFGGGGFGGGGGCMGGDPSSNGGSSSSSSSGSETTSGQLNYGGNSFNYTITRHHR